MPQKLFDKDGNEVETLTPEEVKALQEAAAAVEQLKKDIKELEEGANPNWREMRKKEKDLEAAVADWKAKAEAAGHKSEPTGVSKEDAERIADERAENALLRDHRNTVLSRFGDKREVVEKAFEKLAAGEKLDRAKIEEIATQAARATGVERQVSDTSRSVASRGTSAPDFGNGEEKKKDFADTEEGKATRDAMGLSPEPKKEGAK